jgi:quercetin 2,3-dioxygenase
MPIDLDTADSRGTFKNAWLFSRHTFSFSGYMNPDRMGFGMLRVINDDVVEPSMGFSTHPHENMEIISVPLTGSLRHEDNMGNKHVISAGEVQVMSAGTGITHSEYNNSEAADVNFLQIWVLPKHLNIEPRYDQKTINLSERKNSFELIIAPLENSQIDSNVAQINQDAYFSLALTDANTAIEYEKYDASNGVYFFIVEGKITVASKELSRRDGVAISGEATLNIECQEASTILCMEVPLS